MSCRRCSRCGLHLPPSFLDCPGCGEKTAWFSNVDPDPDWQQTVELMRAEKDARGDENVAGWRRGRLAELGFAGAMLDLLADSPVDVHRLADLVGRGCPAETAARILL